MPILVIVGQLALMAGLLWLSRWLKKTRQQLVATREPLFGKTQQTKGRLKRMNGFLVQLVSISVMGWVVNGLSALLASRFRVFNRVRWLMPLVVKKLGR